jgi:hypothetical protein
MELMARLADSVCQSGTTHACAHCILTESENKSRAFLGVLFIISLPLSSGVILTEKS